MGVQNAMIETIARLKLQREARAAAADLHGALGVTLRAIWPATKSLELTWPRWASRADVDELQRRGLIDERDFTPLGREVLRILVAERQCAPSPMTETKDET